MVGFRGAGERVEVDWVVRGLGMIMAALFGIIGLVL